MRDQQADLIVRKARKALAPREFPQAFNSVASSSEDITDERLTAAYEAAFPQSGLSFKSSIYRRVCWNSGNPFSSCRRPLPAMLVLDQGFQFLE